MTDMGRINLALLLLEVCMCCLDVHAGRAPTWDYCECRWDSWKSWSDCSSTCFGNRQRSRSVYITEHTGCTEFSHCASNDMGGEYEGCNEVCHNGGTAMSFSLSCTCQPGYYGRCCDNLVDCGHPGEVEHGHVAVSKTTYGGTSTYVCNQHYNVTGGDQVRTCQSEFAWSGAEPTCVFVNTCGSRPCQNDATCINGLNRYTCVCPEAWIGQHSKQDVLPPVMAYCPGEMSVYATDRTHFVNWTEPTFHYPRGHDVTVMGNYNDPAFEFPWGDFTVQYTAVKPFNGLESNCTFDIHVRPTPCPELNVPVDGMRLCNNWAKDYGLYCILACKENFTISPTHFYSQWYVCGASGNWIAAAPMPDCAVEVFSTDDALAYHPKYREFSFPSCAGDDVTAMKQLYMAQLTSVEFGSICTERQDSCNTQSVDVQCGF